MLSLSLRQVRPHLLPPPDLPAVCCVCVWRLQTHCVRVCFIPLWWRRRAEAETIRENCPFKFFFLPSVRLVSSGGWNTKLIRSVANDAFFLFWGLLVSSLGEPMHDAPDVPDVLHALIYSPYVKANTLFNLLLHFSTFTFWRKRKRDFPLYFCFSSPWSSPHMVFILFHSFVTRLCFHMFCFSFCTLST